MREQRAEDIDELTSSVEAAVHDALQSCDEMRMREAAALVDDLSARLASFSAVLKV